MDGRRGAAKEFIVRCLLVEIRRSFQHRADLGPQSGKRLGRAIAQPQLHFHDFVHGLDGGAKSDLVW